MFDRIRGFFPNCVATFRGKSLKIISTIPLGPQYYPQLPPEYQTLAQTLAKDWPNLSTLTGSPGEVVKVVKNMGAIVQTGDGLLLLNEVQLAGKRPQTGGDFANGTRLKPGDQIDNG